MTQLTFIRRLFLKQGCLRFLDHTVLCRSFFGESGGIITLSLIWWDYSVIFHQSLLDMEASHFPRVHTSQIHLPVVKVHGTVPEVHGLQKPIITRELCHLLLPWCRWALDLFGWDH